MAPWRSCQHRDGEPYDTCISALVCQCRAWARCVNDQNILQTIRYWTTRSTDVLFTRLVLFRTVFLAFWKSEAPFHQGSNNRDTQQLYAYSKGQRMLPWCCLCGDLARITHRITSVRRSDGHDSELNASRTSLPWKRWVPSWSSPTP